MIWFFLKCVLFQLSVYPIFLLLMLIPGLIQLGLSKLENKFPVFITINGILGGVVILLLAAPHGFVISKAVKITLEKHTDWWPLWLYFWGATCATPYIFLSKESILHQMPILPIIPSLIGYLYGIWSDGFISIFYFKLAKILSV